MTGRVLALIFAIAGAAAPAAGAAPAAAADGNPPLPASLGGFACRPAANPFNRLIAVSATMRPLPATERMSMRFQLLQRLPGQRFHQLHGGDLGSWLHPTPVTFGQQPGDTWVVNKPVANLAAPAVYRFRVTFRWVGAAGAIGTAARLGPLCAQPR